MIDENISNNIHNRLLGINRNMEEDRAHDYYEQMQILSKNKREILAIHKSLTENVRHIDINKDDWESYVLEAKIPSREASEMQGIIDQLGEGQTLTNILVGSFYESSQGDYETMYLEIGSNVEKIGSNVEEEQEFLSEIAKPDISRIDLPYIKSAEEVKTEFEVEDGLILEQIILQLKEDGEYLEKLRRTYDASSKRYEIFKGMNGDNIYNLANNGPIKDDWSSHKGSRLELTDKVDADPSTSWKKDLTIRKNVLAMLMAGADRFNNIFNVYLIRTPKFQWDWNGGESTVQALMAEVLISGEPQKIKVPNRWLSQLGGANVSPAVLSFLTNSVTNGDETINDDIKTVKRFGRDVHHVLFNQRKGQGNEVSIALTANWEANIIFDIWKLEHQTDTADGILAESISMIPNVDDFIKNKTSIIHAMPAVFGGDSHYRYDIVVVDVSGIKRQVITNTTILPAAWTVYKDVHFTNFGELAFSRTGPEELSSTLKGNYLDVESGITNLAFLN